MSTLKYICLSDLHLGADYSLLTWMGEDGKVDLRKPSETLATLGTALRQYVKQLSGPVPPTLVLMGDVLDLGQSPYGDVVQGFRRFVEALFPAGEPLVFSTELLTVPGNHDHHLWSTAQDQHLLEQLAPIPGKEVIPVRPESTPLFDTGHWHCSLLTSVMRGYAHLRDTHVDLAYPNRGFLNADRSRGVVLHHGHYVDSTYLAMSALNAQMQGTQGTSGRPRQVDSVERQNGAWVDFLFSDLGSSGKVGKDIVTLYETLRDAGAAHAFSQKLSAKLLKLLSSSLGVGANTEITKGITVANVVKALVDVTLVRGAESERDSYARVLSTEGLADLRWYIGGPVQQQLKEEEKALKGEQFLGLEHLSFVFGHTHKPFQDQLSIAGYAHPVCIYNTGGWVMDQPTMTPAQGAAAVFIDDAMNLASLRLFNDPVNGEFTEVHAAGVGGFEDHDNPLLAHMTEVLRPKEAAWSAFSHQARTAAERHARVLLQTYFKYSPNQ